MRFSYEKFTSLANAQENCWLLTNGLGGFASTSAGFSVSRCDQGILIAARSPSHRWNLVHRLSESLLTGAERVFLSSQQFADDTAEEDGWRRLARFTFDGTPRWEYHVRRVQITRRCAMAQASNAAAVVYDVRNDGSAPCQLQVTPLFAFAPKGSAPQVPPSVRWNAGVVQGEGCAVSIHTDGLLHTVPPDAELLFYADDAKDGRAEKGFAARCCTILLDVPAGTSSRLSISFSSEPSAATGAEILAAAQARRQALERQCRFQDPIAVELFCSADAFVAARSTTGGQTIIAGFPFFADWGRDTMIALPGCILARKEYGTAKSILRTFLAYEKDGLVPNLFPEDGTPPQYNSADAPLLLINCLWLYYQRTGDRNFVMEAWPVLVRIVRAYETGAPFAIGMDADGLIHAGEGLDQVTWMDVRIGNILPTPRHDKPVEINAYWYNALCILARLAPIVGEPSESYEKLADKVKQSFVDKFWMEERGYLRDVLSGTKTGTQIRCNQIWAVTMPFSMLTPAQKASVTETVRRHLYTPFGLRTLSPEDPDYHPFYGGTQRERDMAYHQGTIWPYPLGAWYLAYLEVHGNTREAAAEVRSMLRNLPAMLREGCAGQIPEIYDGENPGVSKGCFAQAWSVGELLRVFEKLEEIEKQSSPAQEVHSR